MEMRTQVTQLPDKARMDMPSDLDGITDLHRAQAQLERASKILNHQHERNLLPVKPAYASIIAYNIACCH